LFLSLVILLAQLLDLNQQVAAGHPVTAPGLPLPLEKRAAYITDDCIQPPGD
jgi:hypothetical protein